ncbi:MAG TPA: hypothetical protein VMY41_11315 [Thermohalobaculum sp.]|nr:hypothetical protein [Thermohalobaculum sp.]
MTPETIDSVRDSFRRLLPIADMAAETSLDRLFHIAPKLYGQSTDGRDRQRRTLVVTVAFVIKHLEDFEDILSMTYALDIRSHLICLGEAGDTPFRMAMLDVLQAMLGADWSPQLKDAWSECFNAFLRAAQRTCPSATMAA